MVHSEQVSMMKDHKEKKQGHHNPVNQKGLFLGVGSEDPKRTDSDRQTGGQDHGRRKVESFDKEIGRIGIKERSTHPLQDFCETKPIGHIGRNILGRIEIHSEEPHFHGPSPFFSDTALLLRNNFHWVLFRGSTKQPDISRPNNAPVYIIVSTLVEINNFWTKRKNFCINNSLLN